LSWRRDNIPPEGFGSDEVLPDSQCGISITKGEIMTSLRAMRLAPSDLKRSAISAAVLLFLGIPIYYYVSIGKLYFYDYLLLRLVVCYIAAYCAYLLKNRHQMLFWITILVAFFFNPIALAFMRPVVVLLDLAAAVFLLFVAQKSRTLGADSVVENKNHLKALLIAGCVALAIDVSLVGSFRFNFGDDPTIHDRINEYLGAPALLLVKRIIPEQDFILGWYGILLVSALFYGFVVWLILSIWWRVWPKRRVNM
jgi:hypothetical protein